MTNKNRLNRLIVNLAIQVVSCTMYILNIKCRLHPEILNSFPMTGVYNYIRITIYMKNQLIIIKYTIQLLSCRICWTEEIRNKTPDTNRHNFTVYTPHITDQIVGLQEFILS